MPVRDRIAGGLTRLAKVFGTAVPPEIQAAEVAAGMDAGTPFSPGEPLSPYDGYSRTPRSQNFVPQYNVSARPRSHERVAFSTLKGLIEAYDIAQIAIWHRIDSIRALEWSLVAADGYAGDIADAVALGMAALAKPDKQTPFGTWLGEWLYDVLAYDAGALWRMRNRAGSTVGLRVVDGTTLAPLLDDWGGTPEPPAPAYVQYVNGLPWGWHTTKDLIYQPFRKISGSPYGRAPLEAVLLNANTDLRFQAYFLQRFCYDEQTEILTRDGWKRFPDVRGDEEFATRSATGQFEWQASKDGKLHVFDSGGTMVEFRNRDVDLLVTPNHRMLTRRKRQGKGLLQTKRDWEYDWHIRRADEFLLRCTVDWRLPVTSSWTATEQPSERFALTASGRGVKTKVDMPMWAFARLLGIFVAEGHLRRPTPGKYNRWEINVSQTAGGKLDEVERILKDTGLTWSYYADGNTGRFSVSSKALWTYLEQCGYGAENKVLPDEVMDWPVELLKELLYGLMTGDGTVNPSGLPTYITTSRRLADQVQEIWQKCGVYSSVAVKQPHPTSYGKLAQYHVRSRRDDEFQMPTPTAVTYHGNVYCVAVPNGIVLVRRNGKTMWCGNTEGNIPEAFASAPESWTPDQIEQFQQAWDALMLGDQEIKSQIKWIPGGGKIEWSNEKDFSDAFSLHLLRKTFAAYHVVPSDAGFTQEINKSSGETQSDVQHRLGDVPLAKHVDGVLTSFLQDDLHLPIKFQFDFGEEQDDRLQTAQADDIYAKMGAISVSDIRELRYGLPEPEGHRVARFIFSERGGPIPLAALEAVAGPIDPATGAPQPGAPLPHDVFQPVEGVEANPPTPRPPLAVDLYGPQALPITAPQALPALPPAPADAVEKDGPTSGITSATGITGYDLIGRHDDEDDETPPTPTVTKGAQVRAAELAAFRVFAKGRRRAGKWRDFTFTALDPVQAHRLNDTGRLAVRKAAGQVAVAGLAVLAADTGRVLMLQRALDDHDRAAGTWEFPGGHLEGDETPVQGAAREWAEETGCTPPAGIEVGYWLSADGVYQGIVWLIGHETDVPVFDDRDQVTNPDDPDGDQIEALAWWSPNQLPGNPAVRPELLDAIDDVMDALTTVSLAKAAGGEPPPKAGSPQDGEPPAQQWPGWQLDLEAAAYWAPLIAAALAGAVSAHALTAAFLRDHPNAAAPTGSTATAVDDAATALTPQATAWVQRERDTIEAALRPVLEGLCSDGYLIGAASAQGVMQAIDAGRPLETATADTGDWIVGDTEAAQLLLGDLGQGDGLRTLLDREQIRIKSIADSRLDELGRHLAAGAVRGDSADTIAADITALLSNPARAQMIAATELCRAVNAASYDGYKRAGHATKEVITAQDERVCPVCEANAEAGAIPIDEPFPSGEMYGPFHPNDRCAIVPGLTTRHNI